MMSRNVAPPRRCTGCGTLYYPSEGVASGYAGVLDADGAELVPGTIAHRARVRARGRRAKARRSTRCPVCAKGGRWQGGSKVWSSLPVLMRGEYRIVRASDPEWRRVRADKLAQVNGLCERCESVATEVHHIEGTNYALGLDMEGLPIKGGRFDMEMLEALCTECHRLETAGG